MNAIEEIKAILKDYPHAKFESEGNSITIFPDSEDGYEVTLREFENACFVSLDVWHEDFEDKEEAMNVVRWALCVESRMRLHYYVKYAYKWTFETKVEDRWVENGTTILPFYPFWKKPTIRYLQNDLLKEEIERAYLPIKD